jgi:hypothetical protein
MGLPFCADGWMAQQVGHDLNDPSTILPLEDPD